MAHQDPTPIDLARGDDGENNELESIRINCFDGGYTVHLSMSKGNSYSQVDDKLFDNLEDTMTFVEKTLKDEEKEEEKEEEEGEGESK